MTQATPRIRWLDKRRLRRAAQLRRSGDLKREEYDALVVRFTAMALQRRLEPGSRIDHYTFTDAAVRALAGDNADDAEMDSSYDKYGPYNYSVIQLGQLVGQGRDTGTTVELVWSMQAEELYHRARAKIARLGAVLLRADQWLSQQRKLFPALSPALEKVIYAIIAFVVGLIVGRLGG